jgi:hypothetical protein
MLPPALLDGSDWLLKAGQGTAIGVPARPEFDIFLVFQLFGLRALNFRGQSTGYKIALLINLKYSFDKT